MRRLISAAGFVLAFFSLSAYMLTPENSFGQTKSGLPYKVLAPMTHGNLTVFPVVSDTSFETSVLMTLDEGVRSGQVVVTESGQATGLVRPRPIQSGVWTERPVPFAGNSGRVNELTLTNKSDQPLILLAGEIVSGGKQDRVVGRDRIIPAHSDPVALGVFCVEPHRWQATSTQFDSLPFSLAQPSVRSKAMANQNQQEVWNEVARSRSALLAAVPMSQREIGSSSSYARAMQNEDVRKEINLIAGPIERSFEKLSGELRSRHAVGVVVALNGELIWSDVFASPQLFEKYWPKLIRSYAAEAIRPRFAPAIAKFVATQEGAQAFLDILSAKRETIESEPSVYRNTEIIGEDFEAFILTGLLPKVNFNIHIAKMKR